MDFIETLLLIVFIIFLVVLYLKVIREYFSLSDLWNLLLSKLGLKQSKYTKVKYEIKSELESMKKEKKELEEMIKETKKRYMKHKIDESTYKEIVKENEAKIIQIDLKLKKFGNYM